MMDSRRIVIPKLPLTNAPSSSGPRCRITPAIRASSARSAGAPFKPYFPAMPHMFLARLPEQLAGEPAELRDHPLDRELAAHPLPGALAHGPSPRRVLQELPDALRHPRGLSRGHEESRHPVLDQFRRAPDRGGDDRSTERHRLE